VANLILKRMRAKGVLAGEPFSYHDKGSMATIGRASAVADLHFVRFDGFLGWLAWLFVHLMLLVRYENRMLVLLQWAWSYFTRNRAARLITGERSLTELDQALHDQVRYEA
jgi:NADH:ubiquinone reductase (H+-translocating)